jgi:glycosyltransferase involved in cell wall biosynthesis
MSLFYKYKVEHSGCDVLFIANDLIPYTSVKTNLRKVVVIHDLKCIKNKYPLGPDSFIKASFLFYKKFLLSADTIIAISNYTKKDILDNFEKVNSENIRVVYNSICLSNIEAAPEMSDVIGEKYILYVNTLQKYKNIETLLYAFAMIKDNVSNNLVVVGKATEYWNKEMIPLLAKLELTNRVIQIQNLSDAELKYVYTHASLFVTTSLHEGFGYSPIEAACCNVPVISSKCEALYETTCGLVDYYESELNYNNLAHTMLHVILNPPEKNKLLYISNFFKNKYSAKIQGELLLDILMII